MQIYNNTFNPNAAVNFMTCTIEDGVIYRTDSYGKKEAIGIEKNIYNELLDKHDEYYNQLIAAGLIVPPKTQEEINQEMLDALKSSQELNQQLINQIKELTSKEVGNNETKPKANTNSGTGARTNVPKPKNNTSNQ